MQVTTLGYIQKDNKLLMLHRIRKKNDLNHEKWIGIGGKLENGETLLDCMQRECLEETGLVWHHPQLKGLITFNFRKHPEDPVFSELMALYTGSDISGSLEDCDEGELEWVPVDRIGKLNLWKGDRIFLTLMLEEQDLFYLRLDYLDDDLVLAELNGQPVHPEDPRWM